MNCFVRTAACRYVPVAPETAQQAIDVVVDAVETLRTRPHIWRQLPKRFRSREFLGAGAGASAGAGAGAGARRAAGSTHDDDGDNSNSANITSHRQLGVVRMVLDGTCGAGDHVPTSSDAAADPQQQSSSSSSSNSVWSELMWHLVRIYDRTHGGGGAGGRRRGDGGGGGRGVLASPVARAQNAFLSDSRLVAWLRQTGLLTKHVLRQARTRQQRGAFRPAPPQPQPKRQIHRRRRRQAPQHQQSRQHIITVVAITRDDLVQAAARTPLLSDLAQLLTGRRVPGLIRVSTRSAANNGTSSNVASVGGRSSGIRAAPSLLSSSSNAQNLRRRNLAATLQHVRRHLPDAFRRHSGLSRRMLVDHILRGNAPAVMAALHAFATLISSGCHGGGGDGGDGNGNDGGGDGGGHQGDKKYGRPSRHDDDDDDRHRQNSAASARRAGHSAEPVGVRIDSRDDDDDDDDDDDVTSSTVRVAASTVGSARSTPQQHALRRQRWAAAPSSHRQQRRSVVDSGNTASAIDSGTGNDDGGGGGDDDDDLMMMAIREMENSANMTLVDVGVSLFNSPTAVDAPASVARSRLHGAATAAAAAAAAATTSPSSLLKRAHANNITRHGFLHAHSQSRQAVAAAPESSSQRRRRRRRRRDRQTAADGSPGATLPQYFVDPAESHHAVSAAQRQQQQQQQQQHHHQQQQQQQQQHPDVHADSEHHTTRAAGWSPTTADTTTPPPRTLIPAATNTATATTTATTTTTTTTTAVGGWLHKLGLPLGDVAEVQPAPHSSPSKRPPAAVFMCVTACLCPSCVSFVRSFVRLHQRRRVIIFAFHRRQHAADTDGRAVWLFDWMDGWMDGWLDGWLDGRMNGWMVG